MEQAGGGGIDNDKYYLYNKGTLGVPFTTTAVWTDGSYSTAVLPVFNSNNIYLSGGSGTGTTDTSATGTQDKVDLTDYKTLKICARASGINQRLCISSSRNISETACIAFIKFSNSDQYAEYSIDVSALIGTYYIGVLGLGSNRYVYFNELWLEKNDDMPLPAKSIEFEEWLHQSASHQIEIAKDIINVVAPASAGWITWATKEMWDFTGYNKLIVRGTISNYSSNDLVFGYDITQSKSTAEWWYSAPAYTTKRNNGAFSLTLDISSRTGSYYIAFAAASFNVQIDHVILAQ